MDNNSCVRGAEYCIAQGMYMQTNYNIKKNLFGLLPIKPITPRKWPLRKFSKNHSSSVPKHFTSFEIWQIDLHGF